MTSTTYCARAFPSMGMFRSRHQLVNSDTSTGTSTRVIPDASIFFHAWSNTANRSSYVFSRRSGSAATSRSFCHSVDEYQPTPATGLRPSLGFVAFLRVTTSRVPKSQQRDLVCEGQRILRLPHLEMRR